MSSHYRLKSHGMFERLDENSIEPNRVVFLSVEGNTTEVQYFNFVKQNKEKLGIRSVVHIEVLGRGDTKSDPDHVLELLQEYMDIREENSFENVISNLGLKEYDKKFISQYLTDSSQLSPIKKRKFEETLRAEKIDLAYLRYLRMIGGQQGDVFGIVIDRDSASHSEKQINRVIKKCYEKGYRFFLSNPCFEFWLLLHVADVRKEYKDEEIDFLKNEVNDKGNSFTSEKLYELTRIRKKIQKKDFDKYFLHNIDVACNRAKTFASGEDLKNRIGSNIWQIFEILRE